MSKKLFSKFMNKTDGSVAILSAVILVVLVGATGVGVDTYTSQSTDTALTHVVDLTCDRLFKADIAVFPNVSSVRKMAQGFADNLKAGTAAKEAVVVVSTSSDGYAQTGDFNVSASATFTPTFTAVIGAKPFTMKKTSTCKRKEDITDLTKDPKCNVVLSFLDLTRKNTVSVNELAHYAAVEEVGGGTLNFVYTVVDINNTITSRKLFSQDFSIDPSNTAMFKDNGKDQIMYVQVLNKDGSIPPLGKQCITDNTPKPPTPPKDPTKRPDLTTTCKRGNENTFAGAIDLSAGEMSGRIKVNGDWEMTDLSNYVVEPAIKDVVSGVTSVIKVTSKLTGEMISVPITSHFSKLDPLDPEVIAATKELGGIDPESAFLIGMIAPIKRDSSQYYNSNARTLRLDKGYLLDRIIGGAFASWQLPDDVEGYCPTSTSPIVVDLTNKGQIDITGTSTAQKADRTKLGKAVNFDIYGNGSPKKMEWLTGNGQGFLVDNRDGNAAKDMSGKRLFGNTTQYENGYLKLAANFKTDANGIILGDNLKGLAVWVDNGDGIVQNDEIKSLFELGVTEISTRIESVKDPKGDMLMRSHVVRNNKRIMSEDVWFGVAR